MITGKDKPYLLLINDEGLAYSGSIQYMLTNKELNQILNACQKTLNVYKEHNIDDLEIYKENDRALNEEIKSLGGQRKEKHPDTSIYLMKDEINGFIKIGRANNPESRERTLQSEKPTIQLIYKCKGFVSDETLLHQKYNKYRIRGEWFRLTNEQIEDIKTFLESKCPVGE